MKKPGLKKPATDKKLDAAAPPDVERHDEIYFRHPKGAKVGRVLSRGEHGCWVECDGARHQVRWTDYHGHKTRVRPEVKVVDQGDDGMLVEDRSGNRRFISDPMATDAGAENGLKPADPLAKSLTPVVLILNAGPADLIKAAGGGRRVAGGAGLSLQTVTDKAGHQTKRWKKTGVEQKGERPSGASAEDAGASRGYGTHNLGRGDKVSFKMGTVAGKGEIVGTGAKGATVKDADGHLHKIEWGSISGHDAPKGDKPKMETGKPLVSQDPVDPDKFSAGDYAASHNDVNASAESVLASFPPDTKAKISEVQERLSGIEQTIDMHRDGEMYAEERAALHRAIIGEFLSPEKLKAAMPAPGERPVLTMLGGRGGSGKGSFDGKKHPEAKVYDASKAIILDPDEIKARLPEYEGWNAHQVHEESSDIADAIVMGAKLAGANLVIDATMKSMKSAMSKVDEFDAAGYDIEAHYMHLPRQEAAKRAVGRFLGKTQRYVPIDVVLANTDNEKVFDEVRKRAKRWSFRDNNVPEGQPPKLISEGGA